jgi:hypothetical protein
MPKPFLFGSLAQLESDIIVTMLEGLKGWRPDLDYPQSYSDMQACVRALLIMYKVERRPLPEPLLIICHACDGLGKFKQDEVHSKTCEKCNGRGYLRKI